MPEMGPSYVPPVEGVAGEIFSRGLAGVRRRAVVLLAAVSLLPFGAPLLRAQLPGTNLDEARVKPYTLPDPLVMQDGARATTPKQWFQERRPRIARLLEENMYGVSPPKPREKFALESTAKDALNGTAIRKQVTITIEHGGASRTVSLLLYLPKNAKGPVPVFLGLNFGGNQAVNPDPGIVITKAWVPNGRGVENHHATEATRGLAAGRWPIDLILEHGYGVATMYCGEIDPDYDGGAEQGVPGLYGKPGEARSGDTWGAIAAWAWGLSRGLDYLETDRAVDAKRVIVIGHSRLAKAALWAGASDTRFAIVVSNESGEGGAALSHRNFGETIKNLCDRFPHWFCLNYCRFAGHEDNLPFDSPWVIALIAPRPVYMASAMGDQWSDPRGEFLGALGASPVYRLLGTDGLTASEMPGLKQPAMSTIGYHIRPGKHDITPYDWEQYLKFADLHLKAKRAQR